MPAYRSPLEMPMQIPQINSCACCGKTPAMEPEFYNQVVIYCDNDDCDQLGEAQAMGHSVAEAAAKWNTRQPKREAA